jgi:hypothetical protein
MMPDERGSISRKRKAPVPDSISAPKKPPKKKAKTSAGEIILTLGKFNTDPFRLLAIVDGPATHSVSSPLPNSAISKSQRQRRPPQRNATPGPSNDTIPPKPKAKPSASVAHNKKRLRTPDAIESDWSPPPVSSLKSGRVPRPTAKSLASGMLNTASTPGTYVHGQYSNPGTPCSLKKVSKVIFKESEKCVFS